MILVIIVSNILNIWDSVLLGYLCIKKIVEKNDIYIVVDYEIWGVCNG